MNEFDYTIIIPHYNIPDLLSRCLKSIPQRENIQVVVVDDCSPNSANYYDEIPELSRSNVELYSTNQGGSAGRARNVGLKHAKGKWITFLDADDLFVDNVEDIFEKYCGRTEDVIFFETKSCMSDNLTILSDRNFYRGYFEKYFKTGNDKDLRFGFEALWGKFIKKELIDRHNIRFDEVMYSNDVYFSGMIGVMAKDIFVSKEVVYIVTERDGSLTARKMDCIQELMIRYDVALRLQTMYDSHKINYRKFFFTAYLNLMWNKNISLFVQEFMKLSLTNKLRYMICVVRHIYHKVILVCR